MTPPFHLAFPVTDLDATRRFYVEVLGADPGRATEAWQDFDLFGHQLSAHRVAQVPAAAASSQVDGVAVPIPHFGVILSWPVWEQLAMRLRDAGVPFLLAPGVRFAGQHGEQGTFFVQDPDGHALEFKAFRRRDEVFA
ncbi:VOC family protein [Isoalcanivorax indicus]|uniref:VOC family protein n=1 Tax=Isoalcanivorax indicus TaxID=2202653 RepID=UPI000DBA587C|nr:VOC family protein [Isoalcanivorax indicus]